LIHFDFLCGIVSVFFGEILRKGMSQQTFRLDVDEIMVAMSLRLGDLDVTKVLAQQCVSMADEDGNGKVSKEELRKFMIQEAKARISPKT